MGVVSRRVVPVCGNLCFFCPSLRARSRQPVKRYKKLLADIFPRNQEVELNDRKIGKLCEYASKNPLRIPMITDSLEQKFYKELRLENFQSVNIVVCIYKKMLSTCKEHMPLFSGSLLAVLQALLDQTGSDEMRILACHTLVDLTNCQVDGTCMVNSGNLISSLCILGQHIRGGGSNSSLPCAVMNALASMVNFMGKHGCISINFEKIISVTLDYLEVHRLPREIDPPHVSENGSTASNVVIFEVVRSEENINNPSYWAMVCLRHMASLAKEATTIRRVLEPMLQCFDLNNQWLQVAYTVLAILQSTLEESGENSHSLLSLIVKHLEHNDVSKNPILQMDIITVIAKLAQNTTQQASMAMIGAISDLMKQLRNSLYHSYKTFGPDDALENKKTDFQLAIENCILQLSKKVGDKGPILDMMAVFMENISSAPFHARSTLFSAYRTAQIISSIPNVSYNNKAFPDALLYQLLLAMTHSDQKTRVAAHRVLSTVLMPRHERNDVDKFVTVDEVEEYKDSRLSSFEENQIRANGFTRALFDGKSVASLRLSRHQVSLVLSSIWIQATLADNMPENFEAMAHTYSLALIFITSKSSKHFGLLRGFQLAFSLRNFSLDRNGGLPASCRRSMFNVASCMLIFCAMASDIHEIIPTLKESLTKEMIDPFLRLVDDIKLQAVKYEISGVKVIYGSKDDDVAASKALAAVASDNHRLKETVASEFIRKHKDLPPEVLSEIKDKFAGDFCPDVYPLGAPLFMETPRSSLRVDRLDSQPFDEVVHDGKFADELNETQATRKNSASVNSLDILSVNELLESVLETARKASYAQAACNPLPYDQIKNQCEALVAGKRHKMSILQSFKHQVFPADDKKTEVILPELGPNLLLSSSVSYDQTSFRLPPATPYDKFLEAAGC